MLTADFLLNNCAPIASATNSNDLKAKVKWHFSRATMDNDVRELVENVINTTNWTKLFEQIQEKITQYSYQ